MNRTAIVLALMGLAVSNAWSAEKAAAPAAPAGKSKTELTWFGHAAFAVRTPGGTVLAIDPWLSNPAIKDKAAAEKLQAEKLQKVDFILVTHGHSDHVGEAVALAKRTGAKLVATADLGGALVGGAGYPKDQVSFATLGNPGGTISLNDEVSVSFVPAVHGSTVMKDEQSPPLAGGNPVGFVIRIKGGPTLYHTGDTDVFGDMKLIGDRFPIDVMLAVIGGHFTMDPAGAALAASLVKPKQIVPMHFGTFPMLKGTPADLEQALKKRGVKATVTPMQIGETRVY